MPTFKTVKASGEHRPNAPRFHSDHCASIFIVTAWWRRHAGPKADDASMLVHTGLSPSPALVACENENIDNLDLLTSLDSMNSADTMYSYQRIEDSVKPPSPEHNSESYEQIFTDPTISVIVFDLSSAMVLVRLLKTSHHIRSMVKAYIAKAFTVDRVVCRYFDDTSLFRSVQNHTATIISGSAALQFFDRSFYPGSDLNLHVPMSGVDVLFTFLLGNGYAFVPHIGQDFDLGRALAESALPLWRENGVTTMRGIAGVFVFTKIPGGRELKIEVVVAFHASLDTILHYHSSMS